MTRFICKNCGETMWEDEKSSYAEETGEIWSCCPYCGDTDLVEVEECNDCGGEFEADQVYRGICLKCLRERVGYDIAFDYIKEKGDIVEFILFDWFGSEGKINPSIDLTLFCEETYKRIVADEKLLNKVDFLAALTDYCVPDADAYTIENEMFADWLIKYQSNKNRRYYQNDRKTVSRI